MHEPVRVKHLLEKGDMQLFAFVNFLYYIFTPFNEEIRRLQVKDIREKTIFIPSSRAKNNRACTGAVFTELYFLFEARLKRILCLFIPDAAQHALFRWRVEGSGYSPRRSEGSLSRQQVPSCTFNQQMNTPIPF